MSNLVGSMFGGAGGPGGPGGAEQPGEGGAQGGPPLGAGFDSIFSS